MKSIFFLVAIVASIGAKSQNEIPFVKVQGEVQNPLQLTIASLSKMKQVEIKAKVHDGPEHTYKGVLLATVLDSAGVTLGKKLKGENLSKFILMEAADGYKVVFSLAEVDPEMSSQVVLLAYQVDGKPLGKEDGPFRMVVQTDKRPARWIRQLVNIKVMIAKQ